MRVKVSNSGLAGAWQHSLLATAYSMKMQISHIGNFKKKKKLK